MITRAMVNEACAENEWVFGNNVLYDLCASYPLHSDPGEVIAKIWLIGRGYAPSEFSSAQALPIQDQAAANQSVAVSMRD